MTRFADAPTTSVEVHVPAPATEVWPHVADIGLSPRHSDEHVSAEWLDGANEPAVGARFRGWNESGDVRWDTTCTVTECDAPRRFTWVVGPLDDAVATWGFELEEDGDGTRLRQRVVLGPGPSGITAAIERRPDEEEAIIERRLGRLAANMQRNVDAVRDAVTG